MAQDHGDLQETIKGLLAALDRIEASGDPSAVSRAENIRNVRERLQGGLTKEEDEEVTRLGLLMDDE